MTGTVLALLAGGLLTSGLWLVLTGALRRPPRLSEALHMLHPHSAAPSPNTVLAEESGWWENLGATAFRRFRLPLSDTQWKGLQLQGRSIGDFYAEKMIFALIGVVAPAVGGALLVTILDMTAYVPAVAGLVGGIAGFFIPDILLHRRRAADHSDAREALFTYFDLVVLERLANRSGPQALSSAAEVSQHVVFARIRATLDRARLEQSAPYPHLRALSKELELSELSDISDVMRLDESGAALVDVLRSRVKEVRDAYLTQQKVEAQAVSERMTLPMTVPTLIFTSILFVPPLLRLLSS